MLSVLMRRTSSIAPSGNPWARRGISLAQHPRERSTRLVPYHHRSSARKLLYHTVLRMGDSGVKIVPARLFSKKPFFLFSGVRRSTNVTGQPFRVVLLPAVRSTPSVVWTSIIINYRGETFQQGYNTPASPRLNSPKWGL